MERFAQRTRTGRACGFCGDRARRAFRRRRTQRGEARDRPADDFLHRDVGDPHGDRRARRRSARSPRRRRRASARRPASSERPSKPPLVPNAASTIRKYAHAAPPSVAIMRGTLISRNTIVASSATSKRKPAGGASEERVQRGSRVETEQTGVRGWDDERDGEQKRNAERNDPGDLVVPTRRHARLPANASHCNDTLATAQRSPRRDRGTVIAVATPNYRRSRRRPNRTRTPHRSAARDRARRDRAADRSSNTSISRSRSGARRRTRSCTKPPTR